MAVHLVFPWLLTVVVGLLTFILVRNYLYIRNLPPGPFPLPIIGNLLSFRFRPGGDVIRDFQKIYGDIFTIWLGSMPFVVVTGLSRIKEVLLERRNDFAGRPDFHTFKTYLDGNYSVSDSDFGKPWDTLRKMGHVAIRKYAVSEKMPELVENVIKEMVDKMLQEKTPFNPSDYVRLAVSTYNASSLFGQRYKEDDPDFFALRSVVDEFQTEVGVVRDLTDSLLMAREEVIAEGKESAIHMHDMNLTYVVADLYFNATESIQFTTRWMLLYLATYQNIQERVIQELKEQIGSRTPVQEDRKSCPYTTAAINEILRVRPPAPFALPHKAICDSKIGCYRIPKGVNVVYHVHGVHNDPHYWKNPESFDPERFLNKDGSLNDARLDHYMPFGQGRRSCIGEKLATYQSFLVIANIFRKCRITLKEPPEDMEPLPVTVFQQPKVYKIQAFPLND